MKYAAVLIVCSFFAHAQEMGALRNLAENKLAPMAGMPPCITLAVESGDPTKGEAMIVFKAPAGCKIPWHWHTPAEHVMIVSGAAKLEMKDGKSAVLTAGGYGLVPRKHVHQFTCVKACTTFISCSSAFDIHYVDADGKEIPVEAALAKK